MEPPSFDFSFHHVSPHEIWNDDTYQDHPPSSNFSFDTFLLPFPTSPTPSSSGPLSGFSSPQSSTYHDSLDGTSSYAGSPATFPSSFHNINKNNNFIDPPPPPPPPPPISNQSSPGFSGLDRHSPRNNSSLKDCPLICLAPNCPARPFTRRADLERHYRHLHSQTILSSYPCDYPRCPRSQDPFHRRDHFRDHLRDCHKEDIVKRGVTVSQDWYLHRNTSKGWWRCGKCLQRVSVRRFGFECPRCKSACCVSRQAVRRRKGGSTRREESESGLDPRGGVVVRHVP